ncbi:hypothetical protein ACOMCU_00265 [Lysinibacillus sp. UGB7]|uniref:hypothetical protein n=1 Tax=Lysinibacillus sp. UGB7 TaxID=3411039 RepID=UPI003B7F9FE9
MSVEMLVIILFVLIGFGALAAVSFALWIMFYTSEQSVDNQDEKGEIGGGNSNYSSYVGGGG